MQQFDVFYGNAVSAHLAGNGETAMHGSLAGMIQVCRPSWSATKACQVAMLLNGHGVREYHEGGNLVEYLIYLETELARHEKEYDSALPHARACEMTVHKWAVYWQHAWDLA